MKPGGEGPLRKVWTRGPVEVWADEPTGLLYVWCNACGRLAFAADSRVGLEIVREAATAHAEKHEA